MLLEDTAQLVEKLGNKRKAVRVQSKSGKIARDKPQRQISVVAFFANWSVTDLRNTVAMAEGFAYTFDEGTKDEGLA